MTLPVPLTLAAYRAFLAGAPVTLDRQRLAAVDAARAGLLAHLASGVAAYGVTTGLGHLAGEQVTDADQAELQRSLLTARAAGLGEPLHSEIVRGAVIARLGEFLTGAAGVSSGLCRRLAALLDAGWAPVVPGGPYGAAGEIGPLAHLFQTLLGEGEVWLDGRRVPAAAELERLGLGPYAPLPKEGIALVNGSPFATALTLHHAPLVERRARAATFIAALSAWATGAATRAWSPRVATLAGGGSATDVATELAALLPSRGDSSQPPVSLRVVPQVHGALLDAARRLEATGVARLRAVTDSPLYLEERDGEPEGLYPSGAFHALDVTLALEGAAAVLAHVVNLVEKRLHRLLDARFSGLPEQLTTRPGVQAGAVALHKTVVGLAVEARTLALPVSLHAFDTSTGQEDVQAHTFLAARRLAESEDVCDRALACELVALRQALHLRGGAPLPDGLRELAGALAQAVPPLEADRTLSADVVAALDVLRSAFSATSHRCSASS